MEHTQPHGDTKYDEIDVETTIDVAGREPLSVPPESSEEQESSSRDRPIGCYYTPGKILFYVKLTDVVEEAKSQEKTEADLGLAKAQGEEGAQQARGAQEADLTKPRGGEFDDIEIEQQADAEFDEVEIEPDDSSDTAESIDQSFPPETTGEFDAGLSGEFDANLSGEFPIPNQMPLASVDQMLAEISFIEGHESLARGDRTGAIWHYNNAISYAPDKVEFFLKLSEVLAEDPNTWVKAERVLIKAIRVAPDELELRTRLEQLRKERKSRQGPKKRKRGSRRQRAKNGESSSSSNGVVKKGVRPGAEYEPGELIKQLAELERNTAADLMKRARKRKLISRRINQRAFLPTDRMLPDKLPRRRWVVLLMLLIAALVGTDYVLSYRGDLTPVTPMTGTALAAQDLEFKWDCNIPDLTYVVEVYDRGDMVMWQITKEKSYRPDLNQKTVFEAEHTYSWIVRGGHNLKKSYQYTTEPQHFHITRVVEPPPAPIAKPVVPAVASPQQAPSKIITPLPPNQTRRID